MQYINVGVFDSGVGGLSVVEAIKKALPDLEIVYKDDAEAATSKTGVITVCVTPRTLESQRYRWLKEQYAKDVRVLEPDCSNWAYMIENNSVDREKVAKIVKESIAAGAEQIVLGCTHYHWIEELIIELAQGRAQALQPEAPAIAQLNWSLTR